MSGLFKMAHPSIMNGFVRMGEKGNHANAEDEKELMTDVTFIQFLSGAHLVYSNHRKLGLTVRSAVKDPGQT